MKDQGPKNKFDIIELLKKTYPKYKITLQHSDFASIDLGLVRDLRPRSYEKGKSIQDIAQTIYITKNFFIRVTVTICFFIVMKQL